MHQQYAYANSKILFFEPWEISRYEKHDKNKRNRHYIQSGVFLQLWSLKFWKCIVSNLK